MGGRLAAGGVSAGGMDGSGDDLPSVFLIDSNNAIGVLTPIVWEFPGEKPGYAVDHSAGL
jgi:hypothetical protein